MLKAANRYLSFFQLIGYSLLLSYVIYLVLEAKEGMGIILLLICLMLFSPFIIVSGYVLFLYKEKNYKVRTGIWFGSGVLLLAAVYSYSVIEKFKLLIIIFSILTTGATLMLSKYPEKQLLTFNVAGSLFLSLLIGYLVATAIN